MTPTEALLLALGLLALGYVGLQILGSQEAPPGGDQAAAPEEPARPPTRTSEPPPRPSQMPAPPPVSSQDAYEVFERGAMPPEIAQGTLVVSERTFRRRGDRPFFAKIDQGFRTPSGYLVLVETKHRLRVTASDIVQLTCQAIALHSQVGNHFGRPAGYGYIRLQPTVGKPIYRAYRLYGVDYINALVDRYHALRMRRQYPEARPHPSRCSTCIFRPACVSVRSRRPD